VTVYLDTSSLVKLYVNETGSDEVRQDLSDATAVATSAVAYPEARAAFAKRRRERAMTPSTYRLIIRDFEADWSAYVVVEPTMELVRQAGELAERYALRGFDSVHLASYLEVVRETGPSSARFSSFDRPLNRAAAAATRRWTR
jgi:predicted nucleic acid-binding protein